MSERSTTTDRTSDHLGAEAFLEQEMGVAEIQRYPAGRKAGRTVPGGDGRGFGRDRFIRIRVVRRDQNPVPLRQAARTRVGRRRPIALAEAGSGGSAADMTHGKLGNWPDRD